MQIIIYVIYLLFIYKYLFTYNKYIICIGYNMQLLYNIWYVYIIIYNYYLLYYILYNAIIWY